MSGRLFICILILIFNTSCDRNPDEETTYSNEILGSPIVDSKFKEDKAEIALSLTVNLDATDYATLTTNSNEPHTWLHTKFDSKNYFSRTNPLSYNNKLELLYIGKAGIQHRADVYFRRIKPDHLSLNFYWQIISYIDDDIQVPYIEGGELINAVNTDAALLQFDAKGKLETAISTRQDIEKSTIQYKVEHNNTQDEKYILTLDLANSTQYGIEYEHYTELELQHPRIEPVATTHVELNLNIDGSEVPIPIGIEFDKADPLSFNHVAAMTVYNSLGSEHVLQLYFRKLNRDLGVNTWAIFLFINGSPLLPSNDLHSLLQARVPSEMMPVVIDFSADGTFSNAINTGSEESIIKFESISVGYVVDPLTISIDFGEVTQYGNEFSVNHMQQNGNTALRRKLSE